MTVFELAPETRLSQIWDDLITGADDADPLDTDARFVANLHRQLDMPSPSPEIENQIWASVMSTAVDSLATSAITSDSTLASILSRLLAVLPAIAWTMIAGLSGGFFAGIASRLSMRLSGFLTIQANRFLHTDAEAVVGRFTLGGTLFLGGLGAAAGVLTVGFYVLMRSRLPWTGWRRSLAFATVLYLVFGYVLMDPGNPDYHRFGPAWVNVTSFSLLYFIMGIAVSQIYEHRPAVFAPSRQSTHSLRLRIAMAPILLAATGVGVFFGLLAIILGPKVFMIPAIAFLAWLIARTGLHRRVSNQSLPVVVRQWGVWVVPGIVGFTLTARGVTEILLHR